MIDVVNHSVKVDDIGLLQFMYPDFIILDKLPLFTNRPIIFIGDAKYINKIKELGVDYIFILDLPEVDLTKREVLLEVAFNKWNKKVPKYLLEFYKDLDDFTFREQFEYLWLTGKWNLKEYDNSGAFLEFLYSFKTDTYNIAKTYLQLLDKVRCRVYRNELTYFFKSSSFA